MIFEAEASVYTQPNREVTGNLRVNKREDTEANHKPEERQKRGSSERTTARFQQRVLCEDELLSEKQRAAAARH